MGISAAVEQQVIAMAYQSLPEADPALKVDRLSDEKQTEVLSFLAERPIHTVFMSGFIRDNGLASDLNRGTFYGCWNPNGQLEGVALIGHTTLVEARTPGALAAFARLAQDCPVAHMILGEQEKVADFWSHFAKAGHTQRRACRQVLFEKQACDLNLKPMSGISGLRLARPDDLPVLLPIYAEMVHEESQVNPLEVDPIGFEQRWRRRIDQNRNFVSIENGRLIFNAVVMSETPDVIYLEGVYVNPEERGKGLGERFLSELSRDLLLRVKSLCLLVNEQNQRARRFYERAGFTQAGCYDLVFLHLRN